MFKYRVRHNPYINSITNHNWDWNFPMDTPHVVTRNIHWLVNRRSNFRHQSLYINMNCSHFIWNVTRHAFSIQQFQKPKLLDSCIKFCEDSLVFPITLEEFHKNFRRLFSIDAIAYHTSIGKPNKRNKLCFVIKKNWDVRFLMKTLFRGHWTGCWSHG